MHNLIVLLPNLDGSLENALPLPMQVLSIRYPVANSLPRRVAFWVEFGGVSPVVSGMLTLEPSTAQTRRPRHPVAGVTRFRIRRVR